MSQGSHNWRFRSKRGELHRGSRSEESSTSPPPWRSRNKLSLVNQSGVVYLTVDLSELCYSDPTKLSVLAVEQPRRSLRAEVAHRGQLKYQALPLGGCLVNRAAEGGTA